MKQLFAILLICALLTTPVLAASGPASRSADPATCAHHFEVSVVRQATCADKGLLAYTCAKCGLTYTAETLPDGEHDYALTDSTATCTEDGLATYTCTRCGDSYTEPAPAAGHVPEEQPADCIRGQFCTVCGTLLQPPTGHDFAYQYDARFDENGDLTDYGTWKCANCGSTMAATKGNAIYYYGLEGEGDAEDASDTDLVLSQDASGTDLETVYDDSSPSDADTAAADSTDEPDSTAPADESPAPAEPEDTEPAAGSRTGLWIAISAVALVIIVAEAAALVHSLKKNRTPL